MEVRDNREPIFPRVRFKRSHRKSRSGCLNCKKRRVKCDERKPHCDRCYGRRINCVYENDSKLLQPTVREPTPQASSCDPSSATSSPSSGSTGLDPEVLRINGLSDRQLMETYLNHTVQSFAAIGISDEQMYIWQVLIPAIAYTSDEVRRGMLTLAAVHLFYQKTLSHARSWDCLDIAEFHGEIFVRDSRKLLVELDPLKMDTILACSRLLCVLGFAFFGIHRRSGARLLDDASWTWLQLLRGTKITYDTIVEAGHSVNPVFIKDITWMYRNKHDTAESVSVDMCRDDLVHFIRTSSRERFEAITALLTQAQLSIDDEDFTAMHESIEMLRGLTKDIVSAPKAGQFRLVCIWPANVPKRVILLLREGSPLAHVIYAHWLMLVVLVEGLWWVNDMGRTGIREIVECFAADASILALLRWPQHLLSCESLASCQDGIHS